LQEGNDSQKPATKVEPLLPRCLELVKHIKGKKEKFLFRQAWKKVSGYVAFKKN
jgi:hypothetical protein